MVEDNRLLREGIIGMLKKEADFKVLAGFGDCVKALQSIRESKPDVVLLDLGLRNQSSLQLVRAIKGDSLPAKVIAMDLIPAQADVLEFVKAGVSGFIIKDATTHDFLQTIRSIAGGETILPPVMAGTLFSQIIEYALSGKKTSVILESVRLTRREREVVELIAEGQSNKEIAQRLHLSTYTVKSHVHNILEKLALHTRLQIASHAHDADDRKSAADAVSLIGE
ncbi:MAG TPA: response regulator transcription factor [Candidatus Kryptobacter bacterium]|nr:response regulator transcription factor [Candidatus Kryptobacter bacterium]